MTALDRLLATGAVTRPPRARARDWRLAWSLYGPWILIALGLGLCAGAAARIIEGWPG
ncbi:MAG TPA: hypothetical protein VFW46_15670 [Stellaceae bacterium]|nr:hypothetical protein [Stellaceae bacterium]